MSGGRILVVSPYRGEYGPRRVLDHVVRALVLGGYEPVCAVPPDARIPDAFAELGLEVEVIDSLTTVPRTYNPLRLGSFMKAHLAAAGALEQLGRDRGVVAVYSISEAILCAGLAARRLGVRSFTHAIGMSIQSPRLGALAYVRLLDGVTDVFIACSSAVAGMFAELRVPDTKIMVVHNGISVAAVDAAATDLELGHAGAKVGMVAAYDPRKGHELFLDAAARVVREQPDVRFYLIGGTLAGHPESVAFAQHVDELIRDRGLDAKVERVGYKSAPEVYAWMRAMDVIVVPSRTEAFAHALLEAMACGKPVVATGIEGNLDAFVDGHSGVYTPRDPERLAEHVLALVADPARAAGIGRAARERVELLFDLRATLPANAQVVADTVGAP